MIVVLRRTVVGGDDWHFENLNRSHHQSPLTSSGSIDFVDDFRSVKRGRGKGEGKGEGEGEGEGEGKGEGKSFLLLYMAETWIISGYE